MQECAQAGRTDAARRRDDLRVQRLAKQPKILTVLTTTAMEAIPVFFRINFLS
jgi:hypothetical protein